MDENKATIKEEKEKLISHIRRQKEREQISEKDISFLSRRGRQLLFAELKARENEQG